VSFIYTHLLTNIEKYKTQLASFNANAITSYSQKKLSIKDFPEPKTYQKADYTIVSNVDLSKRLSTKKRSILNKRLIKKLQTRRIMKNRLYLIAVCILFSLLLFPSVLKAKETTLVSSEIKQNIEVGSQLQIDDSPLTNNYSSIGMGLPTDPNYVLLREVEVALVYNRSNKSDVLGKYWRYRVHYELTFPNNNLPSEIGFVELQFEPNAGIYEELKVYKEVPSSAVLTITKVEGYNGNNGVWESFTTSGTPDFNNNDLDYVPNDIRLELRMGIEYYERLDAASIIPINDLGHNL
jgi:hypothetical protein